MTMPNCPKCHSEYTYQDGEHYVCPECAYEWSDADDAEDVLTARDAHGNELRDGDSVTVIKDLKVRGSSMVVKQGTMIKNIRIVEGDHNLDCKVNGTSLQLKSEFMKKA
ncbi:alkylphosphonate utilization protein [Wohlfahrtiimonas chitiniclastica]|uniref:Protein phnA n=2 Tax=Wohlfahrtiimonas chitiniclastica TaxID=400946 RepID=L8XWW5_9GAMM|nr:zinc ribbon domain-containing protein YjdM [Wohlfahrtiimonas chitiniclastica]ELV07255.1 Protein phnA [Wohlfahrtiimonas chitiniclastica SH04]KZX36281.1 alkylphosphonate utilization protein [Wohlfahrtiimonas chitiniclastica]KZX36740.1 alkylphosphonate utilization protein [Wohlfahrtiimonas chitiniclastica]MDC7252022.1 protein PhnA [Wohlfahrtiimonas chitiniclastica]OYQ70358.1 alkylphosphonate utilization protein [Wohlfahrtiimonas chitiniclastica]